MTSTPRRSMFGTSLDELGDPLGLHGLKPSRGIRGTVKVPHLPPLAPLDTLRGGFYLSPRNIAGSPLRVFSPRRRLPDSIHSPRSPGSTHRKFTEQMPCLATLEGHTHAITQLIELPPPMDGKIVTASLDTYLRVWDLATKECVLAIEAHLGGAICLTVVSPTLVASGRCSM